MEYTKGKWKPEMTTDGSRIIRAYTDSEDADEIICRDVRHYNMHLLSAAPDMYEALKTILLNNELGEWESQKRGLPRMIEVRDMARQALAKAEG